MFDGAICIAVLHHLSTEVNTKKRELETWSLQISSF